MSPFTVTEYDHFISFSSENYEGQRIIVQYRRDQVWMDENGVWQVKEGQQPFYTVRSAARQRRELKVSPEISFALGGKVGQQVR